ncbi:hypothetical protein JHK85_014787 [Glycine max]|nr:hypothetical protein JHK85_014787 [Glycine max]
MLASRSKFTKVNSNASQCNKWVPSQNFGGRRHTNKTNMHFNYVKMLFDVNLNFKSRARLAAVAYYSASSHWSSLHHSFGFDFSLNPCTAVPR